MSHGFKVTHAVTLGAGEPWQQAGDTHGEDRSLAFHAASTIRKHHVRRKWGPSDTWPPIRLHPRGSTRPSQRAPARDKVPKHASLAATVHIHSRAVDRYPRTQPLKSSSPAGHPTWTSGVCGMQDFGLSGRRVAICGKGSTSFLGFS